MMEEKKKKMALHVNERKGGGRGGGLYSHEIGSLGKVR